jgi:hypothetical protein
MGILPSPFVSVITSLGPPCPACGQPLDNYAYQCQNCHFDGLKMHPGTYKILKSPYQEPPAYSATNIRCVFCLGDTGEFMGLVEYQYPEKVQWHTKYVTPWPANSGKVGYFLDISDGFSVDPNSPTSLVSLDYADCLENALHNGTYSFAFSVK